MNPLSLLSFDHLIAPTIVKILFYIGVFLSAISAFSIFEFASDYMRFAPAGSGVVLFLVVSVLFVVGVIFARVGCELILVLFMIRDELAWQRERQIAGGAGVVASNAPAATLEAPSATVT